MRSPNTGSRPRSRPARWKRHASPHQAGPSKFLTVACFSKGGWAVWAFGPSIFFHPLLPFLHVRSDTVWSLYIARWGTSYRDRDLRWEKSAWHPEGLSCSPLSPVPIGRLRSPQRHRKRPERHDVAYSLDCRVQQGMPKRYVWCEDWTGLCVDPVQALLKRESKGQSQGCGGGGQPKPPEQNAGAWCLLEGSRIYHLQRGWRRPCFPRLALPTRSSSWPSPFLRTPWHTLLGNFLWHYGYGLLSF